MDNNLISKTAVAIAHSDNGMFFPLFSLLSDVTQQLNYEPNKALNGHTYLYVVFYIASLL